MAALSELAKTYLNRWDPRIMDSWAHYNHKAGLDGTDSFKWVSRDRFPEADVRRLTAYRILSSYMVNNAREALTDIDVDSRLEKREYGDPALIVARVVSGVLGDQLSINLPQMQQALSEEPTLEDRPVDPGEDADDLERFLFDSVAATWEQDKRAEIDEWVRSRGKLAQFRSADRWLNWWMDAEHVVSKITEAEQNYAVPLGDVVYGLAYSTAKGRPTLTIYPPDSYMPELESTYDYPTRVHMVWQEPSSDNADPGEIRMRRITYELLEVALEDGEEGIQYAYDDKPSTMQCYVTDVTFDLSKHPDKAWQKGNVLTWPVSLGEVNVNEDEEPLFQYALGIDFIPLIHVPNTPASVEHFGVSVLARIIRLLDDIIATDTDIQSGSALAGSPMLFGSGIQVDANSPIEVRPGQFIGGPAGSSLDHVDMAASVEILHTTLANLLERLSVNVQIPESMLGRLDESRQFPSGVALRISFQPFIQMIENLRLSRHPKYKLMLKMVQRLHVANGGMISQDSDGNALTGSQSVVDAELVFGEFIPADVETTASIVASLLDSHGISRSVASTMLQEVGLPIPDTKDEVGQIAREDFDGAKSAADATGSEALASELLGYDLNAETEAATLPNAADLPTITLP